LSVCLRLETAPYASYSMPFQIGRWSKNRRKPVLRLQRLESISHMIFLAMKKLGLVLYLAHLNLPLLGQSVKTILCRLRVVQANSHSISIPHLVGNVKYLSCILAVGVSLLGFVASLAFWGIPSVASLVSSQFPKENLFGT
jgi:hypothetical protein